MSSSNFNSAYDSIVSRIQVLLPSHIRLVDAYNVEQNPIMILQQGWGLALGRGGYNSKRFTSKHRTTNITYQLVITRKSFALDLNASDKATTDKNLLEDMRAIIDDIWQNNFNISGSPLISFADFDGISPVKTDKGNFLQVTININVEYIII